MTPQPWFAIFGLLLILTMLGGLLLLVWVLYYGLLIDGWALLHRQHPQPEPEPQQIVITYEDITWQPWQSWQPWQPTPTPARPRLAPVIDLAEARAHAHRRNRRPLTDRLWQLIDRLRYRRFAKVPPPPPGADRPQARRR